MHYAKQKNSLGPLKGVAKQSRIKSIVDISKNKHWYEAVAKLITKNWYSVVKQAIMFFS